MIKALKRIISKATRRTGSQRQTHLRYDRNGRVHIMLIRNGGKP